MDQDLVRWLEQRRLQEGLTAEAFAAALGIHPSVYSRFVNGQRPISKAAAWDIARSFRGECGRVIELWEQDRPA